MRVYKSTDILLKRNGAVEDFMVDGYVDYYEDLNYGADADGNRGTIRIRINDITDIGVYGDNCDNIYDSLSAIEKDIAVEALTAAFLEG